MAIGTPGAPLGPTPWTLGLVKNTFKSKLTHLDSSVTIFDDKFIKKAQCSQCDQNRNIGTQGTPLKPTPMAIRAGEKYF